jgi:preprotein translocase subunit SecD
VIREEIPGGNVVISGKFTEEEARELAARINKAVQASQPGP